MPNPAYMKGAQRPDLHVFYVLDTSGSMGGNPIGVLNSAMDATVDALKQVAAVNSNARVKISVLEFNTTNRWIQPRGPEDMEDFFWDDLDAKGMTYMGDALDELNDKLHRGKFLGSTSGAYLPVIIFMTDGFANDDYESALERIRRNKWFAKATRIGFAIGRCPDEKMISKLTGDSERVIRTDNLGLFAKMLQFVSVSSVTLGSQSHTDDSFDVAHEAIARAHDELDIDRNGTRTGEKYTEQLVGPHGSDGLFVNPNDNTTLW